jgi:hypothetical protein
LAKKTFRFSITYLSILFVALLVDHYFLWDSYEISAHLLFSNSLFCIDCM